jgi:hypothetical protein
MPPSTKTNELPLLLCQVLEKEYQYLGRGLPEGYPIFSAQEPLDDSDEDLFSRLKAALPVVTFAKRTDGVELADRVVEDIKKTAQSLETLDKSKSEIIDMRGLTEGVKGTTEATENLITKAKEGDSSLEEDAEKEGNWVTRAANAIEKFIEGLNFPSPSVDSVPTDAVIKTLRENALAADAFTEELNTDEKLKKQLAEVLRIDTQLTDRLVENLQKIADSANALAGKLKPGDAKGELSTNLKRLVHSVETLCKRITAVSNRNYVYLVDKFKEEIKKDLRKYDYGQPRLKTNEGSKENQPMPPPDTFYQDLRDEINRVRLAELFKHAHKQKLAALCISGGGIRSATFGLGLIQGLAQKGLLDKFDYLSTVSGGGYIGSWLSGWIYHEGAKTVMTALEKPAKNGANSSFLDPEPAPIRHLRTYSNFLAPRLGLFTTDTWTLFATVFRNWILNWFIIIPLMLVVLALPRLFVALVTWNPTGDLRVWALWGSLLLGSLFGIVGLTYLSVFRPGAKQFRNAEKTKKYEAQSWFLWLCLLPTLLSAVFLATFWAWLRIKSHNSLPDVSQIFVKPLGITASSWLIFAFFGAFLHSIAGVLGLLWVKASSLIETLVAAVIIPLSGAIGGILIWLIARFIFPEVLDFSDMSSPIASLYVCFALPLIMLAFLLATTFFAALSSGLSSSTADELLEWLARLGAWVLIVIIAWTAVNVIVLFAPLAIIHQGQIQTYVASVFASSSILSGIATYILGKSSNTSAVGGSNGGWRNLVLSLAAPLFLLLLLIALALASNWLLFLSRVGLGKLNLEGLFSVSTWSMEPYAYVNHVSLINHSPARLIALLILVLLAIGLLMSCLVNVNKFSLHGMYRDRLIRAYLGASRRQRKPNKFTGFDKDDNLPMSVLKANEAKPLHIVNIALNLVKSENLAWQERKAESFTVSTLHSGSSRIGYRDSSVYGGDKDDGISLGTAVAISGAAVNPNMGYHSSPVVTFLLTLLNARLGWWLGNPKNAKTSKSKSPKLSIRPILSELLGLTDDQSRYVNLSDGAHFENLGLYEMVLRRCKYIVVSDAGQDADNSFEDLGNAIRKIRIDLGISIRMEKICIYSRKNLTDPKETKRRYCAIGKICYSDMGASPEDDGVLIYIKPAFYGEDESADIYNYAQSNSTFPHETTGDQFFSESQFESYRQLGLHTIEQICGARWKSRTEAIPSEKLFNALCESTCNYLSGCINLDNKYFDPAPAQMPDMLGPDEVI